MAKVIEVYIPKIFRKPPKWVPAEQLGGVDRICVTGAEVCMNCTSELRAPQLSWVFCPWDRSRSTILDSP